MRIVARWRSRILDWNFYTASFVGDFISDLKRHFDMFGRALEPRSQYCFHLTTMGFSRLGNAACSLLEKFSSGLTDSLLMFLGVFTPALHEFFDHVIHFNTK